MTNGDAAKHECNTCPVGKKPKQMPIGLRSVDSRISGEPLVIVLLMQKHLLKQISQSS
jgi:hypothetical protein